MALPNARNQYLKTQIETASKEQLVVMLFDGIIRFTEQARKAIHEGNIEDTHHALMRAQAIVMELICTVDKDKGGDVAESLMSLHAYAFNCLIVCNMKKDTSKIDEVQKIYRELREAWVGAMDTLGISSTASKPVAAPAPASVAPAAAPVAGKPLSIPKAPLASALPKPVAAPAKAVPVSVPAAAPLKAPEQTGNGILASSAAPATQGVAAVAAKPLPAAGSVATGYGMGKTAMVNSAAKSYAAVPKATVPASVPQQTATPTNSKQAAMLNAYSAGTRSIA